MPDNHGVIVSGGNAGTELLAVGRFKVPLGGNKDISGGIQAQKLRSGLLCQVVGNDEHGLLAQPQTLALHSGGNHFEGLAGSHLMGEERIAAIEHMGDSAKLMGLELDRGIDAGEHDMASVVLTGTDAVHLIVVLPHQLFPPLRVLPQPVLECLLDELLLL